MYKLAFTSVFTQVPHKLWCTVCVGTVGCKVQSVGVETIAKITGCPVEGWSWSWRRVQSTKIHTACSRYAMHNTQYTNNRLVVLMMMYYVQFTLEYWDNCNCNNCTLYPYGFCFKCHHTKHKTQNQTKPNHPSSKIIIRLASNSVWRNSIMDSVVYT